MPGTGRAIEINWESSPELGLFTVESSVKYLGQTQNNPSQRVLIISPLGLVGITLTLIAFILIVRATVKAFRKSKRLERVRIILC